MTVNNKTKNERNILALMTEVIDIALDEREKRHSKSPSISVDDALKKYLMSSQVADSTKRGYKILLDKALPVLGLSPKDEDIVAFRDTRRCKPGGKHLYHRYLRAFYNWLYSPASGYPQFRQEDNPIRFVKPPKVPKRTMPAQTKKTIETLFANIENLRDAAIIAVLFDSGGRRAEISNIQATDILWDKRQIRAIAKGNKEVVMPLGVKSLNLLKQMVAEYHPKWGIVWGSTKNGIVSMLRRLENKSGVKCNAHTFRRGFASELRRNGVDTLDIMKLGHWYSLSMVQ